MADFRVSVTPEAVSSMKKTATKIGDMRTKAEKACVSLETRYDSGKGKFGAHTKELHALLENIRLAQKDSDKYLQLLEKKLSVAATIRQKHLEENGYSGTSLGGVGSGSGTTGASSGAGAGTIGGMTGSGAGTSDGAASSGGGSGAGGGTFAESGIDTASVGNGIKKLLATPLGAIVAVTGVVLTPGVAIAKAFSTPKEQPKVDPSNPLCPTGSSPRHLEKTQYGLHSENGVDVYDSPNELAPFLYAAQGSADAYYQGTCGLCSICNILRMAGVDVSEKDIIEYASKVDNHLNLTYPWEKKLCVTNAMPTLNGGTSPETRQKILEHFGIKSETVSIKDANDKVDEQRAIDLIGSAVSKGKGVILSVNPHSLNPGYYGASGGGSHAVTVTSVTYDNTGRVAGFYICDSNNGTQYFYADEVSEALTGADINITSDIIR